MTAKPFDPHAPISIGRWELLLERGGDAMHLIPALGERGRGSQPPDHTEDVVAAVRLCREHGAAVLPRGAGTAMCGQSVNAAVVVDCSKYLDRVLSIDPAGALERARAHTGAGW